MNNESQRTRSAMFWLIGNNYLAANDIDWHYTKAISIFKFTWGIYSMSENHDYGETEPGSSSPILGYGFAICKHFLFISQSSPSVLHNNWLSNISSKFHC